MSSPPTPSGRWLRFLEWYCAPEFLEEVSGDLVERFEYTLADKGMAKAQRQFAWGVVRFFNYSTIKGSRKLFSQHNTISMYRNFFKIGWRRLRQEKGYALINLLGLTLGLSAALCLYAYVRYEHTYDAHIADADRIVRIVEYEPGENDETIHSAQSSVQVAPLLQAKSTAVETAARLISSSQYLHAPGQPAIQESDFWYADSTTFEVFNHQALHGNLQEALVTPNQVVLTETAARRYYGTTDILDKELIMLTTDGPYSLTVSAVIADPKGPSHLSWGVLVSLATLDVIMPWWNNWYYPKGYTYARTTGANLTSQDVQDIIIPSSPADPATQARKYEVQALTDIHLYSDLEDEITPGANQVYLNVLQWVALFLVLMACVNYINLTTSRSVKRALEVGLRKVMGAWRSQLVHQFLVESFLMISFSVVLALAVAALALPIMQQFLGVSFTLDFLATPAYIVRILLFILGLTLLAGFYPAIVLSGFHPLRAFRVTGKQVTAKSPLRTGLVVFQFALATLLLTGTVGTVQQIGYLKTKDLGFSKETLVSVEVSDAFSQQHLENLKSQLRSLTEVASLSVTSSVPTEDQFWVWEYYPVGEETKDGSTIGMKSLGIDEQFLETYTMDLAYGEGLQAYSGQEHGFLLNAEAARRMGWDPDKPEELLNKQIGFIWYDGGDRVAYEGEVKGLLEDFHFESLYESIDPIVMYQIQPGSYYGDYLTVKLNPGTLSQGMKALEATWSEFHPTLPLDAYFMDDALASQYEKEERLSQVFLFFAGISLVLCLLGLIGLAAYTALQRTKEFGIRKVMGARVPQILQLLYREFSRYIVLGLLVGWPLAALWLVQWLASFAYQMPLGPWPFVAAGGFTLVMAVLVITSQTWRSATRNPIESLRHE